MTSSELRSFWRELIELLAKLSNLYGSPPSDEEILRLQRNIPATEEAVLGEFVRLFQEKGCLTRKSLLRIAGRENHEFAEEAKRALTVGNEPEFQLR